MSELRNIISKTPELLSALDDVNVPFVSIAGTGRFEYVKLGRRRKGAVSVDEAEMRRLRQLLKGGQHVEGEWVARMFSGVGQAGAILIERRPTAIVERLAQNVLNALRLSVKREGDGVVIGPPGASKSSVLLWLSTQITDEAVLFVSENPPAELPGAYITHVFPPNDLSARDFERLLRVSPVVFWDRIRDLKDLQTLSACVGRKWFSLDRSTPEASASLFAAARSGGVRVELSTILALSVSVIGRPEVRSFAFKEPMGWNNLHGPDALLWVGDAEKPSADPTKLFEAPKLGSSLEEKSAGAGIRKRPGHPTMDFDNPLTVPVEALEEISSVDPPSVPEVTRQYPHTPLPEPFSTGTHKPLERPKFQPDAATSSASNDILERIMPMLRDEPMPEVNLENLRITMHEDVDPDDLDVSREQDTASHRAAEFDLQEYADEYHERMKHQDFPDVTDDVLDLDHDYDDDEDDFGNDFSQISEVFQDDLAEILTEDEIATSVASATDYALNSWRSKNFSPDPETSPTGRFSDPIELESIQDVEREDATEEVNLNDKLKLIRERFQRKD